MNLETGGNLQKAKKRRRGKKIRIRTLTDKVGQKVQATEKKIIPFARAFSPVSRH